MSSNDPGVAHYAPKITDREASGYDYFHKAAVENNFIRSEYVIVKPLNALNSGPIWIPIGHDHSNYLIPLDEMQVQMKLQVVKEDGSALESTLNDDASLINFHAQSLFENINGKFCGTSMTDHHRLHQHKVALINTLSYGDGAKRFNMQVERYTTESNTSTTAVDSSCANYVAKQTLVNQSGVFYSNFTPLVDICNGTNFLAMGHSLLLEFERGHSSHVILRKTGKSTNYKIKILDFQVQIKKLFPTQSFQSQLQKKLQTSPANYNFTRNVLRTFQIQQGVSHADWNNIFMGQLPMSMYFIFLDNDQVSSSADSNPHTWLRYDCERAHLIVNGYTHPTQSIKYNEVSGDIYNGFRWLLSNIGIKNSNEDIQIDIEKYYKDKFVIPFDLSHRSDNSFSPQANENGTISFHCEFKTATAKPLTILVLACFDSNLTVTKDKEVILDYAI